MNRGIKILIMTIALILVAVMTVLGTISFITSEDGVVNTFTAGKVSIKLDEAEVDSNGVAVPNGKRVYSNQYKLMPGKTYDKDPTVTVLAGSEESYVRVMVTIYNFSVVNEIVNRISGNTGTDIQIATYGSMLVKTNDCKSAWTYYGVNSIGNDTITFEYRYNGTPDGYNDTTGEAEDNKLIPVFTGLTLPGELTGEDLVKLYGANGDFKIEIEAHAMQKSGFENNENAAWNAFDAQMKQIADSGNGTTP